MHNSTNYDNTYDVPIYLFQQGNNFESYKFFGAHRVNETEQTIIIFVSGHQMPVTFQL